MEGLPTSAKSMTPSRGEDPCGIDERLLADLERKVAQGNG